MNELSAAVLVAQERKLDRLVGDMRALHGRLADGLGRIEGAELRHADDPGATNGAFLITTWPTAEMARDLVAETKRAGVTAVPHGLNNLAFEDWGLHLYDANPSLVHKRGVDRSGHPWTHPANAFAEAYGYGHGALPRADDLFDRSSLLAVPPSMSTEVW